MIVVADTSPFVVLVKIGHVDLLPALFGSVFVPPEVIVELSAPHQPDAVLNFVAEKHDWLQQRSPNAIEFIPNLEAGETAAIALARELNAFRIVIDEKIGRAVASSYGLSVTGTIGILTSAADQNLIELEDVFEKVKRTNFWVKHKFLNDTLQQFRDRHRRVS